jgi:formamidopyrimidine-DNA glycosylase
VPELPEVETVVRELRRTIPGRIIRAVHVTREDLLVESSGKFCRGLEGRTLDDVSRRGKNIVFGLSPPGYLVVNLGMTGKLLLKERQSSRGRRGPKSETDDPPGHLGITFLLEPEAHLHYTDIRRFGSLHRYTVREWTEKSARLGPEPLAPQLSAESFYSRLSSSRSPVRSWLLDQTRVAGVGNIYATEALFLAGVHPRRPARSLNRGDASRLLRALRQVLTEAIQARGTTLRDYRTTGGERGGYGPSLRVYGRESSPCVRCNTSIRRIVFGNRSSFFCPRCQPEE